MSVSDFAENKILDHVLRNTTYTPAGTVYVALFTSDPTDTAGGGTEVTGGAYARTAVTFGAAASGAVANSGAVNFPTATADWGTVTHVALMDAASAGNKLWSGALTVSRNVTNGTAFSFAIGDLTVSLD
jgi:hypothetical protein